MRCASLGALLICMAALAPACADSGFTGGAARKTDDDKSKDKNKDPAAGDDSDDGNGPDGASLPDTANGNKKPPGDGGPILADGGDDQNNKLGTNDTPAAPVPGAPLDEDAHLEVGDKVRECNKPLVEDGGVAFQGYSGKVYKLPEGTAALPDFSKLTPVGQVKSPQLNVPERRFEDGFPGVPDLIEWFGIVFEARIVIPTDGKYEFKTISDDGSKVLIDGELVVMNDGTHAPLEKVGATMALQKGNHRIHVEWFQGPRVKIALQVLWRKVGDANFNVAGPNDLIGVKDCDLKDLGDFN